MAGVTMNLERPWEYGDIRSLLERGRSLRPDDEPRITFLADDGSTAATLTYGELADRAEVVARILRDRAEPLAPVASLIGNTPEFVVLLVACATAGVTLVPVNTAMRGSSLRYVLEQSAPATIVAGREFAAEVSALELDGPELLVAEVALSPDAIAAARDRLPAAPPADNPPGGVSLILYTSGSTGNPKGVQCTWGMLSAWGCSANVAMDYGPSDVVFIALPLFHANALCCAFVPGVARGADLVVAPRFSARGFWRDIAASGATTVNLLGVMEKILRTDLGDAPPPHSLRTSLVIPGPADYAEFEARFGVPATTLYGLTDCAAPLAAPAGTVPPAGACGKATPGWHVELMDEHGAIITEPGVVGELVMRPLVPHIMMHGYLGNDAATAHAWRGLWFHTSDRMSRDADGWFYFAGRESDSIRRGGENVTAFEVESVLLRVPEVSEAAVIGVPSEVYGEEILAILGGVEHDDDFFARVLEECARDLPYFALPRYVAAMPALPRLASEKVDKTSLRKAGLPESVFDAAELIARLRATGPTGSSRSLQHNKE